MLPVCRTFRRWAFPKVVIATSRHPGTGIGRLLECAAFSEPSSATTIGSCALLSTTPCRPIVVLRGQGVSSGRRRSRVRESPRDCGFRPVGSPRGPTCPPLVLTVVEPEALAALVDALRSAGTGARSDRRDGAIVYEELEGGDELPVGWTDRQEAGTYRLERRPTRPASGSRSGRTRGSASSSRPGSGSGRRAATATATVEVDEEPADDQPLAFVGVRACDLHAIAIQDRVFLGGRFVDRDYASRREGAFVVAVNCFEPGGTCFCVSMGTGPRAESGFDIALTEILDGEHRLLAETGSSSAPRCWPSCRRARRCSATWTLPEAVAGAAARMGRTMEAGDLRDLLADNLEHPRWDDVADRCLTCGNCVLVCPTCFCSTRRGPHRPDRGAPSAGGRGTRASRSTTPTSTAAASGRATAPATGSG